jgi:hypothetical protein
MISRQALKGFIFSFLLIVAGGFLFMGSSTQTLSQGIENYPVNASAAIFTLIGLGLIVFGLIVGIASLAA